MPQHNRSSGQEYLAFQRRILQGHTCASVSTAHRLIDWHVGHGVLQGFVATRCKQSLSNPVLNSAVQSTSPDTRTHSPGFVVDDGAQNQRRSEVIRLISPLNAQRVRSTRACDVPYDGSRILHTRTCVIGRTCATFAARPRPAYNVCGSRSRPRYLTFGRSMCHKHKCKRYPVQWSVHLTLKNMRHMLNVRGIRCTPTVSSQCS